VTARRLTRFAGAVLAAPVGVVAALGLTDLARGAPGPAIALALPLRETGHADRVSAVAVAGASALVFALLALLLDGRTPSPAAAPVRAVAVLACALAVQAAALELVRQAASGFAWGAALRSAPPYVDALGALAATAVVHALRSSDRRIPNGLGERSVEGPSPTAPLVKIGP
jgi:hypothetical protein